MQGSSRPESARPDPGGLAAASAEPTTNPTRGFLVVGVGSSAGGVEALREFAGALPSRPGFAVLVVQHMARDRESLLPEILTKASAVPVENARSGQTIEKDRIYVIPPACKMDVATDGKLRVELEEREPGTLPMPIDFLLRSLAQRAGDRAVGVVLSGTGSDGSQGLREIKAAGGITLAQEPSSARYDGMPRAAIATEAVDLVATPTGIAEELVRIARLGARIEEGAAPEPPSESDELDRLFLMLRNETGVDFSHYKRPTIRRRLQRRMVLSRVERLSDYLELLQQRPEELRHLYRDFLIHVTRFLRDPSSFDALSRTVLPAILEDRSRDAPIRVWVPGCSTGEEAYSVAIVLLEFLAQRAPDVTVQIFATDLSEDAIERARSGLYPSNIEADVAEHRLRRFFTRSDGGYRVAQIVRDCCVFARQDVTRDPPFSKLDLIVCRNLMIYLGPILQQRLIQVFHYALKGRGFLMLGEVETVGAQSSLFELLDKQHRLYAKRVGEEPPPLELSFRAMAPLTASSSEPPREVAQSSLQQRANAALLDRYAPPGVVVDADLQIVHARGQTGPYLELSPGTASLSILKMAREGIAHPLRMALQTARKTQRPVRREGLRVRVNGHVRTVDLEITPLPVEGRPFYLVLFEPSASRAEARAAQAEPPRKGKGRARRMARQEPGVKELRQELEATREHLQSMIQDLEAANEELQSANEEILSSNEELQSTNEELDTAREELQSTNEEINTVNEELQGRNEELVRANSDLVNLLGSVQIAIVIVANDLTIRRFTPVAGQVLNLIATDVGRPIGHIKPNIDCPNLEALIADVIDRVTPIEREVQDLEGNWYSLRIRPYKNVENRIEGAVLALVDVNDPKRHAAEIRDRTLYANALLDAVDAPLLALDRSLHVRAVNRAFRSRLAIPGDEPVGRPLFAIEGGRWDLPPLRALLDGTSERETSREIELELEVDGATRRVIAQVQRLPVVEDAAPAVLLFLRPSSDD